LVDRVTEKHFSTFRRSRPAAFAVAFACVLLFAVGFAYVRWPSSAPITFAVTSGSVKGDPGTYIAPVGEEPVVLRFVEGSRITLAPSSRARIGNTTPKGASLVLETGRAFLEIERRPGAEWTVVSGPYSVSVVGTAFSVAWDPTTSTFEVKMVNGVVVVRGPGIEQGVELSGVQHFLVRDPRHGNLPSSWPLPSEQPTAKPEREEAGESAPRIPVPSAGIPRVVAGIPGSGSASKPSISESPTPGSAAPETAAWPALAARGEFKRIVEQAEERGVDGVLQGAGLAELWAFADASRITGRGAYARRALLAVRERFPGSQRAASAAFLLGRMSDDGGSPAGAVTWYDRYLAEAPGGTFAPEAQGRRMVALKRSGNQEAARRSAETYLRVYPSGPYAAVARDMLGE
jgi:TolA-binding protein